MARKFSKEQTSFVPSLFDFDTEPAANVEPPAPLDAPLFSEQVVVQTTATEEIEHVEVVAEEADSAETQTVEHAAPHPVIPETVDVREPDYSSAVFNFPKDEPDDDYNDREEERDSKNPYLQFFLTKKRIPKPVLPPYPYFGGKRKIAHIIWGDKTKQGMFGTDIYNYVEPFGGSMAVMLGRPSWTGKVETVNELNPFIVNFYRAAKFAPKQVAKWCDNPVYEADLHARHVWLITQYKTGFKERVLRDESYFDVKIAGWWVWGMAQWIGSGWCQIREDGVIEDADGELYDTLEDYGRDNPLTDEEKEEVKIARKIPYLSTIGNGVNSVAAGTRGTAEERQPYRGLPYMKSNGQGINGAVLDKEILHASEELVEERGPSRKLPEMLGNRGIRRYTGDEVNEAEALSYAESDGDIKVPRKIPILNHAVGIEATARADDAPSRQLPSIGSMGRGVVAYGRTHSEFNDDDNDISRKMPLLSSAGQGTTAYGRTNSEVAARSLPELNSPRGVGRANLNGEKDELDGLSRQIPMLSGAGQGVTSLKRRAALVDYMMMLAERLQTVRITCGNWDRVMGPSVTSGVGITGVFLDPPYMTGSELYSGVKTNVTMEVLEWCKANWYDPKLKIALCGYEGDMPVPDDWACYEWKAPKGYQTSENDGRARERIWFSPACSDPNANKQVQQTFSFE